MSGVKEVLIVGCIYELYGCTPSMEKADAIQRMKECINTTKVQRFFGAVIFYYV